MTMEQITQLFIEHCRERFIAHERSIDGDEFVFRANDFYYYVCHCWEHEFRQSLEDALPTDEVSA